MATIYQLVTQACERMIQSEYNQPDSQVCQSLSSSSEQNHTGRWHEAVVSQGSPVSCAMLSIMHSRCPTTGSQCYFSLLGGISTKIHEIFFRKTPFFLANIPFLSKGRGSVMKEMILSVICADSS